MVVAVAVALYSGGGVPVSGFRCQPRGLASTAGFWFPVSAKPNGFYAGPGSFWFPFWPVPGELWPVTAVSGFRFEPGLFLFCFGKRKREWERNGNADDAGGVGSRTRFGIGYSRPPRPKIPHHDYQHIRLLCVGA